MEDFKTVFLSSLAKVFPQGEPAVSTVKEFAVLKGEVFSFQIAYWNRELILTPVKLTVESPLAKEIHFKQVENVPVSWMPPILDEDIISDKVGIYPDILREPAKKNVFESCHCQWRSIWGEITPKRTCKAGKYPIKVTLSYTGKDPEGKEMEYCSSEEFTLEVMDAVLPPQKLKNTHWFHSDCLMDYYKVEAFSSEYWRIVENFMRSAVKNGQNMVLTPLFTPPLDTQIGGERPTVQLVKVKKDKEGYHFDLTLLEKWIDTAKKAGIQYFEMSHLFTQWGAKATPKIMVEDENGNVKRAFGWDVKADSKKYKDFLGAFLPVLTAFLKEKKLVKKVYFHTSDEPSEAHLENYASASSILKKHLKGFRLLDALSEVEFYKKGLVEIPIPIVSKLDIFMEEKVPERWTYYCCVPQKTHVNRFIYMPSSRNRVLGALLYRYHVEGFLHWGFNFYNSVFSQYNIDPYCDTCSRDTFPAGDGFLVYPGKGGIPEESIRQKVFMEALQDQRLCELLEEKVGRSAVEKVLDSFAPDGVMKMDSYPKGEENIWKMRKALTDLLRKNP